MDQAKAAGRSVERVTHGLAAPKKLDIMGWQNDGPESERGKRLMLDLR